MILLLDSNSNPKMDSTRNSELLDRLLRSFLLLDTMYDPEPEVVETNLESGRNGDHVLGTTRNFYLDAKRNFERDLRNTSDNLDPHGDLERIPTRNSDQLDLDGGLLELHTIRDDDDDDRRDFG